jgi:hypothetical protein
MGSVRGDGILSHEDASDLIEELPYKGGDPGNQV